MRNVICLSLFTLLLFLWINVAYTEEIAIPKQTSTSNTSPIEDSIQVSIIGTLKTGLVAIGGETTGTSITSGKITWEVDLTDVAKQWKDAPSLNNAKVLISGKLEQIPGIETQARNVVRASKITVLLPNQKPALNKNSNPLKKKVFLPKAPSLRKAPSPSSLQSIDQSGPTRPAN